MDLYFILRFFQLFCPSSPVSAHSWIESGSNTPLSYYTPQRSPPPSLSTPNAHSSPRALPSSLDVGNLELSLLEAMEGLESLGLNGRQPPLLPQKRRGMDGGELSLNSPFCLSGGSSNNGSPTASSPSPGKINETLPSSLRSLFQIEQLGVLHAGTVS